MTSGGSTIYSASYDADDPWKSQTWDGDMTARNGYPIRWTVDDVQGCTSDARGRKPGAANLPASLGASLGGSTFSYDPDGNRYQQATTFNGVTTDTTYIGGLFEVVSTATTTEYRHNIIADGQIVAVHDVQGSTSVAGGRRPGATTIDQSGNAYTKEHRGQVLT